MKKLVSLLLALIMALSLSAGAFAENADLQVILDNLTSEQKSELLAMLLTDMLNSLVEEEPEDRAAPVYDSFSEHMQAYLQSIDLRESDLQLTAATETDTVSLIAGQTDNAYYAELLQNGNFLGILQINNDAAYLSDGTQTYGIKMEEITKLISGLKDSTETAGLSRDQLLADLSTAFGWLNGLWNQVQPAFSVEQVSETERKATVDAPAFAEAFAAGVDAILADEAFEEMFNRYYGVVAAAAQKVNKEVPAVSVADIRAAWDAVKEQVVAELSKVTMELTLKDNEAEYAFALNASIPAADGSQLVITDNGVVAKNYRIASNQLTVENSADPENKLTSSTTYTSKDNGVSVHEELAANGQTLVIDEQLTMDLETGAYKQDGVILLNGDVVADLQATRSLLDKNFDVALNVYPVGFGCHATFDGEKLTVDATVQDQQYGLTAWLEEEDANNLVAHLTVTQNDQTIPVDVRVSFVPMDPEQANEPEVLIVSLVVNNNLMAQCQLGTVPRSGDPALDLGEVNWITAEMIQSLVQMLQYQYQQPTAVEEVPAA